MTLGLFVITNAICDWVQTWVLLPLGPKSLNLVDSASQPPAYSQGAEKSGKKFQKEKKREKTSNNLNFVNFDRSKCSGVEFTFCNKSADTSEWFVPISASRRRRGVWASGRSKKKDSEKVRENYKKWTTDPRWWWLAGAERGSSAYRETFV